MEAGAGLDVQDFDGWTPLHAAAHWGQEEACKVLAENLCNMDLKTNNVSRVVVVVLLLCLCTCGAGCETVLFSSL